MKTNTLMVVGALFIAGWLGMGAATLVGLSKLPPAAQLAPIQVRPTLYAEEVVVMAPDAPVLTARVSER